MASTRSRRFVLHLAHAVFADRVRLVKQPQAQPLHVLILHVARRTSMPTPCATCASSSPAIVHLAARLQREHVLRVESLFDKVADLHQRLRHQFVLIHFERWSSHAIRFALRSVSAPGPSHAPMVALRRTRFTWPSGPIISSRQRSRHHPFPSTNAHLFAGVYVTCPVPPVGETAYQPARMEWQGSVSASTDEAAKRLWNFD